MIEITKVKWDGKKVEIHSVEIVKSYEKESITRSVQQPSPKFKKVFADAVQHAIDILELPKDYAKFGTFVVTGFSINDETGDDERKGIVLTCQKKLEKTNAPAVMNTPHLREPIKDEEYGSPGFYDPESLGKLMERASDVALDFLKGEREQLSTADEAKANGAKKSDQLSLVPGDGAKGAKKKPSTRKKK